MSMKYPQWPSNSIMFRHGVGHDRQGERHELDQKVQGKYNYTIGP